VRTERIAALVLAAGGSTRMGAPKQLLRLEDRSFVRRAVEAASAAGCVPVFVVLGAGAERVREELTGLAVRVVENAAWRDGLGGSIAAGLRALAREDVSACLVLLADQPLVGPCELERLLEAGAEGNLVASRVDGALGPPALFPRALFPSLAALSGDAGARSLLRARSAGVVAVDLGLRALDVDTPADYGTLLARTSVEGNGRLWLGAPAGGGRSRSHSTRRDGPAPRLERVLEHLQVGIAAVRARIDERAAVRRDREARPRLVLDRRELDRRASSKRGERHDGLVVPL
jgi:molybdenum cofactor cytidylyltransferase